MPLRVRDPLIRWPLTAALALMLAVHGASGAWSLRLVWVPLPLVQVAVDGGRLSAALVLRSHASLITAPRILIRKRTQPCWFNWWCWWDRDNFRAYLSWQRVSIVVPLGLPLTILGVLTALAWRDQRRFSGPGLCACGYDLRGLEPVAGLVRCPECGQPRRLRAGSNPTNPTGRTALRGGHKL